MQNVKSKILLAAAFRLCAISLLFTHAASPIYAGTNAGLAGAFLRMGLGARALAMGDVGVALPASGYGIYYNPASLPHLERMTLLTSYSLLPLDRQLNFVGFAAPLHPLTGRAGEAMNAGVGLGWIGANSGDIDARDNDGNQIGTFSNSENAFYFSFGLRLSQMLSVGFSPVILYNSFPDLTQDEALKSTRVGFDAGVIVHPIPRLHLGAQARHINAQYRWDTSTLYGDDGTTQTDKFPRIYRLGAAYDWDFGLLLVGDFETSDQEDHQLHLGGEYTFINLDPYQFSLRAGYDDQDYALGFGFGFPVWKLRGQLDYAYQIQDVPPYDSQVLSFSVALARPKKVEVAPPPALPPPTEKVAAPDTTGQAAKEAAERAKWEAEELARREVELKARQEAELAAKNLLRPVQMDFAKAELNLAAREAALSNAEILKKYPDWKVVIEGHCDERGSREYNLVLGERRARVVEDFFIAQGLAEDRFTVISYGEDRPIDAGHTEAARAKNRRVVLTVQ